jgi:RNA polymerase sigma-70 factor (ECF subfamily)
MPNCEIPDKTKENQLEEWIAEYSSAVLKLCFVYLADSEMAKDAMQDTFVKVWKSMEQFQSRYELSAKAWIMKIAVNTCRDYKRTAWFRHIDMRKSIDELPEPVAPATETSSELFLDVMNLPAKYKQVILLHHFQNMNQSETAQALGISRTSVSKRLKKAYELLRYEPERRENHETS